MIDVIKEAVSNQLRASSTTDPLMPVYLRVAENMAASGSMDNQFRLRELIALYVSDISDAVAAKAPQSVIDKLEAKLKLLTSE